MNQLLPLAMTETAESEARRLRAAIYGEVTDVSWAALATLWTRPENMQWLRQHQPVHCARCPPGLHWKAWNGHADAPTSLTGSA